MDWNEKQKQRFIGQELIDQITKMVDEYPNCDSKVFNDPAISHALKNDEWDRQQKIDFITEYFKCRIYGVEK